MEQTKSDPGRAKLATVLAAPKRNVFPAPEATRTCVVVLGMHRSGTSALTGALGLLGVTLPTDLLGPFPGNPKGHFESTALYTIHERMLATMHTTWHDFRHISPAILNSDVAEKFGAELHDAIKSNYDSPSLFVLKDPRTCRFFPLCHSIITASGASPRIVFIFRNPLEVARSLKARDGLSLSHGLGLWLRHVLDGEFHSRGLPRVFTDYSDFLQDWRTSIGVIEQQLGLSLPGRWTDAEDAVDDFVEAELRHETSSIKELEGRFGDQSWISNCYKALAELVRDPDDREAMERLDIIRADFEEPANLFARGINEYYAEILGLKSNFAAQADQLEEAVAERIAAQQKNEKLDNSITELNSELEVLRAQQAHASGILDAQQENETLKSLITERDSEIEGLRAEHAYTVGNLVEIESQLREARQQIIQLEQAIVAKDGSHASECSRLASELSVLHEEHAAGQADLAQQLEKAMKEVSERQMSLEAAQESLREMRQNHLQLRETLSEQLSHGDQLQTTLMTQVNSIAKKDRELAEFKSELQTTKSQLGVATISAERFGRLEADLAAAQARVAKSEQASQLAFRQRTEEKARLEEALAEARVRLTKSEQVSQASLRQRTEEKARLEANLAEARASIAQSEQDAQTVVSEEIARLEKDLAAAQRHIAKAEDTAHAALRQRNEEKARLEANLAEARARIAKSEQVSQASLRQRTEEKARLEADLAEARACIAQSEQDAQTVVSEEIARLEKDLAAAQRHIAKAEDTAHAALRQRTEEKTRLEGDLTEARARIAKLEKASQLALRQMSGEKARLEVDLAQARFELETAALTLDTRTIELQSMLLSTSWLCTKPIRWIGGKYPAIGRLVRRMKK